MKKQRSVAGPDNLDLLKLLQRLKWLGFYYKHWKYNMIIYMATSMTSGLSYIGKSTQDFWKRRSDHKYEALVRKRKSCFYQAIREFGYDDFFWTILANVRNTKQLEAKEKHYIKLFDTVNKGYNTQYR